MGALASLPQREEVRRSLKALEGAGTIVSGDPEHVDVIGADATRGAFLSPVLLRADDPDRAEPHEVEAFGPVATLLPYTSVDQVIGLAARGQGSLAGSVVTGDHEFARQVVLGIAPWHGRLLVLDTEDARESTGHGSPLPALVHGGPGRAGGGEEMGGIRGVLHHMQRTAVQGSPATLSAVTGRWVPGAPRTEGVHPFRKPLRELRNWPATPWCRTPRARSPAPTSTTSPSSPATRSTRTRTRPPRPPTRCSAGSWRTATWWCRSPPACSWRPKPGPVLAELRSW